MRIIAGTLRSRPLRALEGNGTRPTSDKLRGTLFNVLTAAARIEGSVWIDLFAGTGAVGIEAISRGASRAYLVESGRGAAKTIRDNLRALGIEAMAELVEAEAAQAVRNLGARGVRADFIFLDPPYDAHSEYEKTLKAIAASEAMQANTIVVAEHDKRFDPGAEFPDVSRYRTLVQGDAALSFYRRR